jgi:protein involved in polysaccharide export with SLBB domain
MGKARTIRITILGEVGRQGTYTLSAFNTALNALGRAGGITPLGNLRKIEIKRDGRTIEIIDLYKYLQKNKNVDDLYLEDNDYIYVDVYEKIVSADGLFKRPMYYQLSGDEGLKDLVEFAGGPTYNARNSLIHIKTISNEAEKYIDIPGRQYFDTYQNDEYNDIVLNDGDVVSLKPINPGLKNVVRISGAVNYPDEYEVRQGEKLSDIIKRAGGIASTAYLPRAYVTRGSNPLETDALKIDLRDFENNPSQNIELFAGDNISILSTKDFETQYFIDVLGNVRKPTRFKYTKNIKLKDALLLAGGLNMDAENGRIEISNIIDSVNQYNIKTKGSNVKIISINSNLEIDEISENIVLKPLDRIYVRKKIEFINQEFVQVFGELNYVGEYPLIEQNERISSVIKRAGGVKKIAYPEGAKLYRENIGAVVIDLPKILQKNNSKEDLILKGGDLLIIPTLSEIVSVRGEVQQPINIKFDKSNTNINYYIQNAGGYGVAPWKKRINIRYQNGRLASTKRFLFIRKYPKVTEGCTIFVPKKIAKERKNNGAEIFSYALSAITTLATLIVLSRSLNK